MRNFTSYFLAVSLPNIYLKNYESMLEELQQSIPSLQLSRKETPHITLFYLTKQAKDDFETVERVVRENLDALANTSLTVSGIDFFGGDTPKVIFLDVHYPNEVKEFSLVLKNDLREYSAKDNELPFHPHLTLAVLKDQKTRNDVSENRAKLQKIGRQVSWKFKVTDIALYGADSKEFPEYQELLSYLKVNS